MHWVQEIKMRWNVFQLPHCLLFKWCVVTCTLLLVICNELASSKIMAGYCCTVKSEKKYFKRIINSVYSLAFSDDFKQAFLSCILNCISLHTNGSHPFASLCSDVYLSTQRACDQVNNAADHSTSKVIVSCQNWPLQSNFPQSGVRCSLLAGELYQLETLLNWRKQPSFMPFALNGWHLTIVIRK